MYLKTDGSNTVVKWPYTIETLKQENPNVSFPDTIPESVLNSYNVHLYLESAMPDYDGMTETLVRDTPALQDGTWVQGWTKQNLPNDMAEDNVRRERNRLLGETDHLALSDNTLSTEMATYRQALRDVPSQSDFPFSVTWPTKP